MSYCQKCGNERAVPQKYEFPSGQKVTMNHCNDCAAEVYRYIRNEWSEIRESINKTQERAKKEQETKEKAEKQKKFNDWKSSHCAKCDTKALLWHYIYDQRTNKLDWSLDNATNPDQQWVFCSEDHFHEWHNQYYYQCQECSKTGLGGALYNKKDRKKFCSDGCYEKHYAKDCDNCGIKAIKSYYSDATNKTGNLCENCYDLKKLKEELEKLKDKSKENNFTCSQCNKNRTGEDVCFYNSVTNDDKKFCSKECFAEYYGEKCDVCSNKIGLNDKSYYQDAKNKTGTLCASCWKTKKGQENNSPSSPEQEESNQEEERSERPTISPTSPNHPLSNNSNPSHRPNNNKISFSEAKRAIRSNKKINIDDHDFTEEEKKQLRELEALERKNREQNLEEGKSLSDRLKFPIMISLGILVMVVILVKISRRKKVHIKKNN